MSTVRGQWPAGANDRPGTLLQTCPVHPGVQYTGDTCPRCHRIITAFTTKDGKR